MAASRGLNFRGQLKTRRWQELLQQVAWPHPLTQQRDELCQLLQELKTKIDQVEGWLEAKADADLQVQRLRTHYGIGT